ncbi:MAG TPA: TlpA disulfide reductase family protein, partial [Isosphaeraceae bacterium]
MRCPRNPSALARGALGLALLAPGAARAQDAPEKADRPASAAREEPNFESREALNQHYDQRFAELDRRRIADLVALAGRVAGPEAEASYRDAFTLAVTRDLYDAAEPGADAYLGSGRTSPQTRALAEFVKIIAQASRQEYTQAVRSLEQFLKNQQAAAAAGPGQKADPNTVFAIGEAFLQRLMRAGRYDTARQVGALLAGSTDPTVRQHFTSRMARLEMLGKPAPPLAASDIDGRRIDLATLRGKVVLINFWVTWAPPSVAEIPHLNTLASQYGPRGFEVVGVNLDAAQQGADPARVQAGVRQFLV